MITFFTVVIVSRIEMCLDDKETTILIYEGNHIQFIHVDFKQH